jgi:ABC-type Fe3+ transport system permease subunit
MRLRVRKDTLQFIARGWIVVGSLVCLFELVMAIAHFVFGVPIQDRNTGQPMTPEHAFRSFLYMFGGAALFVVMGFFLNRAVSKWDNDG